MVTTEVMMTAPERAIYQALTRLQIPFEFQSKMLGGREVKGGAIIDFAVPSLGLLIRVMGEYFHSRPDTKARDELQKIALETSGWRVIDIDARDALSNAYFYVNEALRFIDHSRQL